MSSLYPTYTNKQVHDLLAHIGLGDLDVQETLRLNKMTTRHEKKDEKLAILTDIMQHCLNTLPFENLTLHYGPTKTVSTDHDVILDKVLVRGGSQRGVRGGYCMENNTLLGTLLRSLGFTVRLVPSRVWDGTAWGGPTHMIALVRIGSTWYQTDLGFGPSGPTQPVPLPPKSEASSDDGPSDVQPQISPACVRLVWRNPKVYLTKEQLAIGNSEAVNGLAFSDDFDDDDGSKMWIYEISFAYDRADVFTPEWTPVYCFAEWEWFPTDIAVVNLFPSTSDTTWFTQMIFCVRFVFGHELPSLTDGKVEVDVEESNRIVGQMILLDGNVKLRVHGDLVELPFPARAESGSGYTCKSEAERVEVLRRYYNIYLSEAQQRRIVRTWTQIK